MSVVTVAEVPIDFDNWITMETLDIQHLGQLFFFFIGLLSPKEVLNVLKLRIWRARFGTSGLVPCREVDYTYCVLIWESTVGGSTV